MEILNLSLKKRVYVICEAIESRNATDIICLDMRGQSHVADFFLICSGTSAKQIQKLAKEIEIQIRGCGERDYRIEGEKVGLWILMDFGDLVVHIFHHETRKYYDLERLWGDVPRLDLNLLIGKGGEDVINDKRQM